MTFTDEPLFSVVQYVQAWRVEAQPGAVLELKVLDPDLGQGRFSGERLELGGRGFRHRPYRTWLDLADRLHCRLLTPHAEDGGLVRLRFTPLDPARAWHQEERTRDPTEKYGVGSSFSRLDKLEKPTFLLDYRECLLRVGLPPGGAVLDLGINTGDEFAPFEALFGPQFAERLSFTGIDYAGSALERAHSRFPGGNFTFVRADLNALHRLELGRFDLVISVGTLQSPGVRSHELLRRVVQHHLESRSGLVLGFPNCRYEDGEVLYGAKMKNFAEPDLSLLVKDLAFYKRYLQQHRFRVFITGKYYLFLTAVRS